jgi:hypothetical protein
MRNIEIWRSELVSEIRTIADSSELRRLWSGRSPQKISSFAEEVAHIFDDYDIDGFIAQGPSRAGLNSTQFSALCRFRDRFSYFLEGMAPGAATSVAHEQVLADPKWHDVMKAASEFTKLIGE